MWLVAKYNSGQSEILKKNLKNFLGNDLEYYQPKILIELTNKKFFKNILGDYIFFKHNKFSDERFINNLRFAKGLKYFLTNYKLEQKQISNFINKCKSHEKEKILGQEFFDDLINFRGKLTTGPFKSFIFNIISKNKNYIIARINSYKITVKKKKNCFLPV